MSCLVRRDHPNNLPGFLTSKTETIDPQNVRGETFGKETYSPPDL